MASDHPRSFDDLLTLFPNLGVDGSKPEAADKVKAAGSCYKILDDAFGDAEVAEVLRCWSANNKDMLVMAQHRLSADDEVVRQTAIKKRLEPHGGRENLGPDVVKYYENSVDAQMAALDEMVRLARPFDHIPMIHRGAALPTHQFDAEFTIGGTVRWPHMTACTLDAEFVPLHYAWKQRTCLLTKPASGEVTSFILNIRLDVAPPLVWTGAVPGKDEFSTFRWQTEVVTPPGFGFKITDLRELRPGSADRLIAVDAKYAPPVIGSPAS